MQGNLFTASATGLSTQLKSENRLALTLAIQRICRRATAEGKTMVRPATLRKMERQVSQLRKAMGASASR
jgi:ribosomal protein S10